MNIFGSTLPVMVCLEGSAVLGWAAVNVQEFDHNTFSSSPQIDLGLLNFGPLHLFAGQQCKSKARRSHSVPNVMIPPCCASKQHLLPLYLCSLRYHSL